MELSGKIIVVLPAQSGVSKRTNNPWMSQDYVLEVPGQYTRKMVFRAFGEDRIKQFNIKEGEEVTVQFDIDAREFNGRWYNDVRAYNVLHGVPGQQVAAQNATSFPPAQNGNPFPPAQPAAEQAAPANGEAKDDLPF